MPSYFRQLQVTYSWPFKNRFQVKNTKSTFILSSASNIRDKKLLISLFSKNYFSFNIFTCTYLLDCMSQISSKEELNTFAKKYPKTHEKLTVKNHSDEVNIIFKGKKWQQIDFKMFRGLQVLNNMLHTRRHSGNSSNLVQRVWERTHSTGNL